MPVVTRYQTARANKRRRLRDVPAVPRTRSKWAETRNDAFPIFCKHVCKYSAKFYQAVFILRSVCTWTSDGLREMPLRKSLWTACRKLIVPADPDDPKARLSVDMPTYVLDQDTPVYCAQSLSLFYATNQASFARLAHDCDLVRALLYEYLRGKGRNWARRVFGILVYSHPFVFLNGTLRMDRYTFGFCGPQYYRTVISALSREESVRHTLVTYIQAATLLVRAARRRVDGTPKERSIRKQIIGLHCAFLREVRRPIRPYV